MKNKKRGPDWTPRPFLSRASPGPRKPPILPILSGSRGGSGDVGAHGDGAAELHAPAIAALL